ELFPRYDADGVVEGFFLGGRKNGEKYADWMRVQLDPSGRALEVTDHYGLRVQVRYDQDGEMTGWSSSAGDVRLKRTAQGLPEPIGASWGRRQANTYDPKDGTLKRTEITEGEAKAVVEFERGRPTVVRQFDGGELRIAYHEGGAYQGRPREVR